MKQITFRDRRPGFTFHLFRLILCGFAVLLVSKGASAQKAASEPVAVPPESVAALQLRVKNLEDQIVDLRAMIGTFSSMGQRSGPSRSQGRAAYGDPGVGTGEQGAGVGEQGALAQPSTALPWQGNIREDSQEDQQRSAENPDGLEPNSKTVLPSKHPDVREDGINSDRMASTKPIAGPPAVPGNASSGTAPLHQAPAGPVARPEDNSDAQSLYKDAYSHMLRRDYASAQNAFGSLVKNHPQSRMAGNAQYWLGETYYVRGKYRPAADAFLKAYRNYSNGVKAPDSLMKLALSLARLGEKAAACKTFDELDAKYPNAPSHVKQRAGMEKRRAGCN